MAHIGVFRREDFDPGAYMVALYHAQAALAGTDHRLSLFTFQPESLKRTADSAHDVDGLLAFGPRDSDLEFLLGSHRPWIVAEQVVEQGNYIAPDNPDMGRTAARYLLKLGHTHLAVALPGVKGQLGSYHGTRLSGFLAGAEESGHPVADDDVLYAGKTHEGGAEIARLLISRSLLPHAIYFQNLSQVMGALPVLRTAGIRIPQDLSVVGTSFTQLNHAEAAAHTDPPLTAVTFNKEDMGTKGVEYLLSRLSGEIADPCRVLLPGVLVERQSAQRRI